MGGENTSPSQQRHRNRRIPVAWRETCSLSHIMAKRIFVHCRYCAYSPLHIPGNGTCPKCGGHSWERFAVPIRARRLKKKQAG